MGTHGNSIAAWCWAGKNRSVTTCLYQRYLIECDGQSVIECIKVHSIGLRGGSTQVDGFSREKVCYAVMVRVWKAYLGALL